jgi:hypothetical protein
MEEQWNVIYVDISNREMTSRTLDSRESARLHASDLNRDHHEVLRLTGPDGAGSSVPASLIGSGKTQCEAKCARTRGRARRGSPWAETARGEKVFAAFSIWRTASSHRRRAGVAWAVPSRRFSPPPEGELSPPRGQLLSKASIAASAVMWALAGFAPVTMRPLVTENASNGDSGAT